MSDDLFQQTLDRIEQLRRLPVSTYRLQLHGKFTFRDALTILPYLSDLGVTHVYCSPYLKATPGSTHGYDVIDHCRLNDEIGSERDYADFVAGLREHGLQQILDTVPNHVGVATNDNHWWNDVLAHGPSSRYANHFDIAWKGSPRRRMHDKVLLPVLGSPYAQVLEKGELKLTRDGDRLWVQYYDRLFPISPESAAKIGDLADYAGKPGDPASWDRLDGLLDEQHYRLAWWESAPDEINYRRFFNVNSLAGLRQERREVFEETHALTMSLLADGRVAGLRIDHPDGLANPKQYFDRLQQYYLLSVAKTIFDAQRGGGTHDWEAAKSQLLQRISNRKLRPLYVAVEKILGMSEPLPADWAMSGTTGYDFLALVNAWLVDPSGKKPLTDFYAKLTGCSQSSEELVYQKKRLILDAELASELRMLAMQLAELAQRDRRSIDFTLRALHTILRETIACFPVYRTYIGPGHISGQDAGYVEQAIDAAIGRNPPQFSPIFNYLRDVLLLRYPRNASEEVRIAQDKFVEKFQQLTSPTTAKGIEDTTFYIYNRLTSLNEVGGNPGKFSVSTDELHHYFQVRQEKWPLGLSPLTTHDTKRSEDVRARISVLSEISGEWQAAVEKWSAVNAPLRRWIGDQTAPSANDEYLLYQTLIGAWPLGRPTADEFDDFAKRVSAYMLKAMREAKVHTNWTHPHSEYEKAVDDFLHALLDRSGSPEFFAMFEPLAKKVRDIGIVNSLSQTLLRLTAPGVSDTYQGSELWDLSLVDPDNRRPVDYPRRQSMLADLQSRWQSGERGELLRNLWTTREDARIKLLLTWRLLEERRARPDLFTAGEYAALSSSGPASSHLFSFLRRHRNDTLLVIAPRHTAGLGTFPWKADNFGQTTFDAPNLPQLRHVLTGKPYSAPNVLADFPVGVYGSW